MYINFTIAGRLGNAIFRYLAVSIMCLYYDGTYVVNESQEQNFDDSLFLSIISDIMNNQKLILNEKGVNMIGYYQHDTIYKINKSLIIDFINNNPEHFVLTDGINSGDSNYEKFYMVDIVNTPITFNKKYKNVLHIRLEDFVTHKLHLDVNRIIKLLDKNIVTESLCIVCKKPITDFENTYIQQVVDYIGDKMTVVLEHNDTITDFYIMKESEILICSKSTLSWSAAFFSNKITKCYLPDYETANNSTCKYPIDNTELY